MSSSHFSLMPMCGVVISQKRLVPSHSRILRVRLLTNLNCQILPPQLAKPFKAVAAHLEVPPVLTYAGANLWNFTTTSTDFTDIDHLRTLVTFTGTESESWFLLISVAMEAKAAGIIQTMIKALEAVKRRDYEVISKALEDLRVCIDEIGVLLDRMYEKCDPMIFYYRIRPFLAGTKNMEAAGLPRGLFFDEGKGKGEWTQWRGGSNGQSSLIQFFDVVLGIEHTSHGSAGQKSFHSEVREYMPGPHHRFLDHVARMGSIRELAMAIGETTMSKEQVDLRTAYTATTDALTQFRNKHIQIVAKYIILPSKQPWTGGSKKNLASSCSESNSKGSGEGEKKQEQGLTGTGGTPLVPFLKRSRDETTEAGKLLRPGAESKKIRVVEEEGKLHAKRQRIHH